MSQTISTIIDNNISINCEVEHYSNSMNFPIGLPASWRMTWDYTFYRINGHKDRYIILKCIANNTLFKYDQADIYSGDFVENYWEQCPWSEKEDEMIPVGLPESWKLYWLYLIERPVCFPICDLILEAIKKNEIHKYTYIELEEMIFMNSGSLEIKTNLNSV